MARSFILGLAVISLLLSLGYFYSKELLQYTMADWKFWLLLGFFLLITIFNQHLLVDASRKRPALFANRYMLTIMLKLVSSFVLFIAVALSSEKSEVLPYGICFLVMYLCFIGLGSYHAMKLKVAAKA